MKLAIRSVVMASLVGAALAALPGKTAAQCTPGINNTAQGVGALPNPAAGCDNSAFGANALNLNTSATDNTAVGVGALQDSTSYLNSQCTTTEIPLPPNSLPGTPPTGFYSPYSCCNTGKAGTGSCLAAGNTAVGSEALNLDTTLDVLNQCTGYGTPYGCCRGQGIGQDCVGVENTAVGFQALQQNNLTSYNTAVGYQALRNDTSPKGCNWEGGYCGGIANTAVGAEALNSNIVGDWNTAVGYGALAANQGGLGNTAVGNGAGGSAGGNWNTALGNNALIENTSGTSPTISSENTAVGYDALYHNQGAGMNTAVGSGALQNNSTGTNNTALGRFALLSNGLPGICYSPGFAEIGMLTPSGTTKSLIVPFSCCTGSSTGNCSGSVSGSNDTAVGQGALQENITGDNNTAVGQNALSSNTTFDITQCSGPTPDPCCGTGAVVEARLGPVLRERCVGHSNTAVGQAALQHNTTASENTAVGQGALESNTSASGNTAVGWAALGHNATAGGNTAVGDQALNSNTTGADNTAIGQQALFSNATLNLNKCISGLDEHGPTCCTGKGMGNCTPSHNTALGWGTLRSNTTASGNTAVGDEALKLNTTGGNNTAVGYQALSNIVGPSVHNLGQRKFGTQNIALGSQAGLNLTGADSNNIDIGSPGVAGESATTRIGNIFQSGVAGKPVCVSPTNQLGVCAPAPSARNDGQPEDPSGTRPSSLARFNSTKDADPSDPERYGLVAAEVAKVYPDLVTYDDKGRPQTVRYQLLAPRLLNEVQKQARQIEMQKALIKQLTEQTRKFAEQVSRVDALSARLAQLEATAGTQRNLPALQTAYRKQPDL